MKTNKLPQPVRSDVQESGSQLQQVSQSGGYYLNNDNARQTDYASNDDSYKHDILNDNYLKRLVRDTSSQAKYFGYKSADNSLLKVKNLDRTDRDDIERNASTRSDVKNLNSINDDNTDVYTIDSVKQPKSITKEAALKSASLEHQTSNSRNDFGHKDFGQKNDFSLGTTHSSYKDIPERIFMNGLIKHTGIALAIIIPLAAFSAYAATPTMPEMTADTTASKTTTETLAIEPSAIIHKSANTPTTVDSVDLKQYAGTWYEIGRLPMYFQRNCAGDVTANYAEKADGSGITVTNKCVDEDGAEIVAEGLAKPDGDTGSKLKVTFLPSWIRWLPVGRADYWVLARDADYKTALVGTPDKDYLWLLARSPNISQETYSKYRQIAQQQGYDLKEFTLTPQTNQMVNLVP
ncbi:lipocalin family protein [Psychrobacter sp. AOP7-D1-15]|uniref:lipocalin family protein n=1 Tax=unclassified Psychrobacter TaxID=196806 RepID=UPI001866E408|nr:lipocalin family protein [Psychrobacter sp. FME61]